MHHVAHLRRRHQRQVRAISTDLTIKILASHAYYVCARVCRSGLMWARFYGGSRLVDAHWRPLSATAARRPKCIRHRRRVNWVESAAQSRYIMLEPCADEEEKQSRPRYSVSACVLRVTVTHDGPGGGTLALFMQSVGVWWVTLHTVNFQSTQCIIILIVDNCTEMDSHKTLNCNKNPSIGCDCVFWDWIEWAINWSTSICQRLLSSGCSGPWQMPHMLCSQSCQRDIRRFTKLPAVNICAVYAQQASSPTKNTRPISSDNECRQQFERYCALWIKNGNYGLLNIHKLATLKLWICTFCFACLGNLKWNLRNSLLV